MNAAMKLVPLTSQSRRVGGRIRSLLNQASDY